jgi:hypothetical protein
MNAQITVGDWQAEAVRRFGADPLKWRFVCPSCGHITAVEDWKKAGAPADTVAFSCVGRFAGKPREAFGETGGGPCNYAGGGLLRINPQPVVDEAGNVHHVFAFADSVDKRGLRDYVLDSVGHRTPQ